MLTNKEFSTIIAEVKELREITKFLDNWANNTDRTSYVAYDSIGVGNSLLFKLPLSDELRSNVIHTLEERCKELRARLERVSIKEVPENADE